MIVYVTLYREWKWHLGEKRSGKSLTSVKSILICWCAAADLLTTIPESSVLVRAKDVRVADQCGAESRLFFNTAFTANFKTLNIRSTRWTVLPNFDLTNAFWIISLSISSSFKNSFHHMKLAAEILGIFISFLSQYQET